MAGSAVQHIRIPHWWYILTTIIIAALLSVIPLPASVQIAWPDWFNLVVFYWVLALPLHLGVTFGWFVGLLEDIVSFSVLGQHAFAKAFTGMLAGIVSTKFQLFNVLEKILLILILQSVNIGVVALINLLALDAPIHLSLWKSALSTAVVWPILSFLLYQFDPNTK